MHPEYLSTQYAMQRPEAKVAVQHHHAHVVSAMVEHGIDGAAIGLAYDGAGYGPDGSMWGGEVLVATRSAFRRVATFRPLCMVGGDRAIRAPWRAALALVHDAYDGAPPPEALAWLTGIPRSDVEVVSTLLRNRVSCPMAHGVGRYFDAFGALFLGRRSASFEGQLALEWNQVADRYVTRSYTFTVDTTRPCVEIDLRPAVREAVADHARGTTVEAIAAAFHNTLADATDAVVRWLIAEVGPLPIVASGGCFQNARLAEAVHAALAPAHEVLFHRTIPPGDGGIAVGQAVIADAISRGEG
jgi:hydrogenase maturation protein HypF